MRLSLNGTHGRETEPFYAPSTAVRSSREVIDVKEKIFIVGDEPILLKTRRILLRDWQTTIASSRQAEEGIRARPCDLLIFGQSVPNETAKRLIAVASQLYPCSASLVIYSTGGEEPHFGSATYRVDLSNPGGLRVAVSKLLDSLPNTGSLRP